MCKMQSGVIDMQISDMLAQYNRSSATGATATAPQQGVQQLVSAVREMTVGNVFDLQNCFSKLDFLRNFAAAK